MDHTRLTSQITAETLVCDVVAENPQTILVFAHHGLKCIGCSIAPFHTIADSAREHAQSIEPLLLDLNRVVGQGQA